MIPWERKKPAPRMRNMPALKDIVLEDIKDMEYLPEQEEADQYQAV